MVSDYDPEEWARRRAEAVPRPATDVLPERTNDFAPPDLFHAAQALHKVLSQDDRAEIDAADDPALWERLDVARAAALLRERNPEAFDAAAQRFPWLTEFAEGAGTGALGAFSDQF